MRVTQCLQGPGLGPSGRRFGPELRENDGWDTQLLIELGHDARWIIILISLVIQRFRQSTFFLLLLLGERFRGQCPS